MVSLASMFPAKPLFEYLLFNKQSRFKVRILLIPDFRFGIENTYKFYDECYKELSAKYGKENIILAPINKNEDKLNISDFTDILFCSLPYDVSHEKYKIKNLAKKIYQLLY